MIKVELTKEEQELLIEELTNSKNERFKQIKNGIFTLSAGILITVILWMLFEQATIISKLIAISLFGTFFGAFKIFWWIINSSIKKLELDIKNGLKIKDKSKIKSYNKRTHAVKLFNGFIMNDFDIQQYSWKLGDVISYEYTVNGRYILTTQITNEASL